MSTQPTLKLLFVVNNASGNNTTDWLSIIDEYFQHSIHQIETFVMPQSFHLELIKEKIASFKPHRVIAVGGDGTIKCVAECLLNTNITLGILPAGSANGMAKELNIPNDPLKAIEICVEGNMQKIHAIDINGELCIHLSDVGFNALVVKKFETAEGRGMWGYTKASWNVLWNQPQIEVEMRINQEIITTKAVMVVMANATKYGSGAIINPNGRLDDDLFEVIVIKKISFTEIFKMLVTHSQYDPSKIEVFQTNFLQLKTKRKAHFQVDGEYQGKVNAIKATILPQCLAVMVPTFA
jgi:YegS/Rv2252/BmrU family lipid kinase